MAVRQEGGWGMSKEAIKLALEALEQLDGIDTETECVTIDVGDVITALREALAEQPAQQEPVVRWDSDGWGDLLVDGLPDGTLLYTSPSNQPGYQAMAMAVTRLQKRCSELEGKQPAQQEPVAWALSHSRGIEFNGKYPMQSSRDEANRMAQQHLGTVTVTPLYTSPPAQQEPVAWMTKDGEIYKHECWPEYEARPLVFGDPSLPAQRKERK